METESSGVTTRALMVIALVVIVGIGAVFIVRNVMGELAQPTPTIVPTAAVVLISPTAADESTREEVIETAELPATNTPQVASIDNPQSTPTNRPTHTPVPTETPIPTPSPTSRPQLIPTLAILTGTQYIKGGGIPTPVPTFQVPLGTTNILLLGSDIPLNEGIGRTDTMIIVAVNRDGPTASMVSLPRDMWVYIPGWTNNRINTALSRGSSVGYPGGSVAQLKDTILYNFGVPIHYFAQIDFEGFKQGVDLIGGVDVAVSCKLRDWRLKEPGLDPEVEENWAMFTLEPGIYHMDGDMALWYARSRLTTSDFDRGRRQQQLLRAVLDQGVDLNLLAQVPEMWNTYQDTVKTDLDIGRILQLAALAPEIQKNGVQNLYIVGNQLEPYIVPTSGAAVQIPVWENVQNTFRRLFLPPALNQATRPPITVEIVNSTTNPDLALLAADNLEWYGFEPIINETQVEEQGTTTIQYYAQNLKGSFDWLISWILDKQSAEIELVPDTPYEYNYRVVLGTDYNPCRPQLFAPQIFIEQQQ